MPHPSRSMAQVTSSLTVVSDSAPPKRSAQSSVICSLTASKFTVTLLFTRYVLVAGTREDNVINLKVLKSNNVSYLSTQHRSPCTVLSLWACL